MQLVVTKSRVRNGFTVLEMVVALGITAGLLVLVAVSAGHFKSHNPAAEGAFWRTVQADWKRAQYDAKYRNQSTVITFFRAKQIRFISDGMVRTLTMPDTITADKQTVIKMRQDGNVQPQTLRFRSTRGWQYKMVIQMGWGVYRLEKTKA